MCEIPANLPAHERKLREEKLEEEEDLVDKLINKSGCSNEHYLVQECMVEHQRLVEPVPEWLAIAI